MLFYFFLGIQTQEYWAYTNNVNLLSAGANSPFVGSTGSGIYSGRKGCITAVMTSNDTSIALVAEVPKDPMINYQITQQNVSNYKNYNINLKRDSLEAYTIRKLNVSAKEESFDLCDDDFCCNFNLHLTENDNYVNQVNSIKLNCLKVEIKKKITIPAGVKFI